MTSQAKLIIGLAALAALAFMIWRVIPPAPGPIGGGPGKEAKGSFNECIALIVAQQSQTQRGLKLDVAQILPRLAKSTDGGGPKLELSANATDQEIFRVLTESQFTSLVTACEQQHGGHVGSINPQIQVWTRYAGREQSPVLVRRARPGSEPCATIAGSCLLVLNNYDSSASETLIATAPQLYGEAEVDAKAVAAGRVTIDLSLSPRHPVVLLSKGEPLTGIKVTIEDAAADGKILSGTCADKGTVTEDCLTAETGSDGRSAVFQIPPAVATLKVSFLLKGTMRVCKATSLGTLFRVSLEKDCGDSVPAPVPACDQGTLNAVRAELAQDPRARGLQVPSVDLTFDIVDRHPRNVKATPSGVDRASLALAILNPEKAFPPGNCHGKLRWND